MSQTVGSNLQIAATKKGKLVTYKEQQLVIGIVEYQKGAPPQEENRGEQRNLRNKKQDFTEEKSGHSFLQYLDSGSIEG